MALGTSADEDGDLGAPTANASGASGMGLCAIRMGLSARTRWTKACWSWLQCLSHGFGLAVVPLNGLVKADHPPPNLIVWAHCTVYLMYVDGIVLTASSPALLHHIISALKHEFAMKDLDQLHHFNIMVKPHPDDMFLQQRQYTLDVIDRASMLD